MIIPSVTNELGRALVEERLREAERDRLTRTARIRTRGNQTWVWWRSRFGRRTRAVRSSADLVQTSAGSGAPVRGARQHG